MNRRILVALAGLSPQVVTETIYGLAVVGTPAWIPDEIHLITTREGAEGARLTPGFRPCSGSLRGIGPLPQQYESAVQRKRPCSAHIPGQRRIS